MNTLLSWRAAVVAMPLLLAACHTPYGWSERTGDEMDSALTQARTASKPEVPAQVSQALLPPMEIKLPEGKSQPLEPRFDLSIANAPARQVFLGLVEDTKYSVVLPPDLRGTVTLNLKGATVPEAFDVLRRAHGYEFRRDGERFYVLGREMQTRLFKVDYLNLVRKGRSDTRVSGGGIGQRTSGTGSTSSSSSSTGQSGTGFSNINVETQSQSDFWKDLQVTLAALVGTDGGRRVVVNPETGVVVVRAMPDELRIVQEYLDATHATVNRQVVLEAKILDIELNDRFQAGINWSKVHGDYTAAQIGGGSTNLSTTGSTPASASSGSLIPGTGTLTAAAGTLTNAFGGVFTLTAMTDNFTAFVELLKAQGNVQVLSSPRVSTVNNQKAVIKIGSDEFFVTGVSSTSTTSTSGGSVASPTVELSSFFSGIVLDVTPQIDESGNIILHVHPSVSSVTEKSKAFTALDQAFNLPLAFSTIQESDNVVRAASGQVVVIGGLMKEGSSDEDSAIPLLGDIPILGNLFKHKKVTRIKRELVILLKPTVINLGQDWDAPIGASQERMKKIRVGS
jgi:MSHA biogenesis protein MshL